MHDVAPVEVAALEAVDQDLSGGDVGGHRDVVDIAQAQQSHLIRLAGLCVDGVAEEQQQIYLALQDAVGSGITLQYPRAGANLSAFTVVDLDGDGEDEALVFYKKTNLAAVENGLRLSVLDQVKGKWMSVCDRPADGTEVERIVVSAMGD